jgi:proteasome inhibitor subunit 1 (PI31)
MASLTPSTLLPLALTLVPPSTTTLVHPADALALLVHAIHTNVGFRLISPVAPRAAGQAEGQLMEEQKNVLGPGWDVGLKFKYRHEQSALEFVVSVVELGGRAIIAAVAVEVSQCSLHTLLHCANTYVARTPSPSRSTSSSQTTSPPPHSPSPSPRPPPETTSAPLSSMHSTLRPASPTSSPSTA